MSGSVQSWFGAFPPCLYDLKMDWMILSRMDMKLISAVAVIRNEYEGEPTSSQKASQSSREEE